MRKRGFIIGVCISAFIAMIDPYIMLKGLSGGVFCWECWAPAAIFALFILLLLPLIHSIFVLQVSELLLIYIMASTASVLPSMGFMSSLMPIITGFKYFATPVNNWQELIIDKTRPLLMLQNENAIKYFYEGLPSGESIPYSAWLKPMGFVLLFVLVFSFLGICLMVLFRKQWVEKERLIYPLTILPLEMVKKEKNSRVPKLFKNKQFWLSFFIVVIYYFLNWFTRRVTGTPMLKLSGHIYLFRRNATLRLNPYFPILGLAYLMPRNVSFSLWLFHILFTFQNGFLNMRGFKIPGTNEHFCGRTAITTFEAGGAMLMFVASLFLRARQHLTDCFKKAFNRNYPIDDSKEMLSYRVAIFGTIISFILMVSFMRYFGMPLFASFMFVLFSVAVFIGLARIICQAGLPAAQAQCIPSAYTSYLLPPEIVSPQGYVAMGLQYSWAADIRTSIMMATGNSLKIQEEARISPKLLSTSIIIAIIVSYVASAWMHIRGGYAIGALNASTSGASGGGGPWFFGGQMANCISNFILPKLTSPISKEIIFSRYLFTGIGALLMGVLMFLHSKFLWWPIHYLGFPIAESQPLGNWWFAIFIAWLIKGLILRFGGHNVYRKSVPFFLGMILGHITWMVIESALNLIIRL